MIKLIRRNEKKALAVASIILMLTFVMSGNGRGGASNNKIVIGHLKGSPIYASDLAEARQEWQALRQYVRVYNPQYQQDFPIALASQIFTLPAFELVNEHPDLFLLLSREARAAGVQVNNDELQGLYVTYYQRPTEEDADTVDDLVKAGLTDLLLIKANYDRVADDVKISRPQRDRQLAEDLQKVQVDFVEMPAGDFAGKVAAPTTQQVQAQFDRFANIDPKKPDATNPFGFGYRLADRIKLQYVQINRSDAEAAVSGSKSPYDWEVAARLYYLQHQENYAATQPTTQGAGQVIISSTGPAYKPFEQVHADVLKDVREPMVDKLMLDVQSKVTSALNADWRAYSQAAGKGTTQPADAYPTYMYLRAIAAAVKQQFQVKLYVTDFDKDYLSAADLSALPAIGQAYAGQVPFATVAMQSATAYLARSDKDTAAAKAQLMQPSGPLSDIVGNVFVYRITDAQPAAAAPSLAAVEDQVGNDLRAQTAYELAKGAANSVLDVARNISLDSAAKAVKKTVQTTDPIGPASRELGISVSLDADARPAFIDQAFKLLSQYDPQNNPHPLALIELPAAGKVFVVQLRKIVSNWTEPDFYKYAALESHQLWLREQMGLKQQWLDYDAVLKRVGYEVGKG